MEWNLTLLYKNEKDPAIEADMVAVEKACEDFAAKYKGANFTASPEALAEVLAEYEKVQTLLDARKPWWYFMLKTRQNAQDVVAQAHVVRLGQRLAAAKNRIVFFRATLVTVPREQRSLFLKHPLLAPYQYQLAHIFRRGEHILSEKEEQLINLLTQTSYSMWVNGQEEVLSEQSVKVKGKMMPLPQASGLLMELPKKERHTVHEEINKVLMAIGKGAATELNAIFNFKKILDERRGYQKPYSETIIDYQNEEKTVEVLVDTVTRYFSIAHRFYKVHARLLGEKKITYADRGAPIGKLKTKFTFPQAVTSVRESLASLDVEYATIFDDMVSQGNIDVYPKKGKRGGAFSWGQAGALPTFVFLNYVDNYYAAAVLAHEIGHSIHTILSKKQPIRYQDYSLATAETASTFFETRFLEKMEKSLSGEEKIIALHARLLKDVSTIFRQIACFNFENELHQQVRAQGQLKAEDMAALMSKHMQAYVGPVMKVGKEDGYGFVAWSHIRRFFYVYSYAFGQLVSRALLARLEKDPSFASKIKEFLSLGGSMSPEDIFKSIGVDVTTAEFFEEGLKSVEKDIIELERLADERGKKGKKPARKVKK